MKKKGIGKLKRNRLKFIPLILLITLVTIFFIQSQFQQTGNVIEIASETTKSTAYIYGSL